MKNWNKIIGLGLSAALLTGVLAGCATTDKPGLKDEPGTASPSPTGSPAATTSAGTDAPLVATEDMIQKFAGIPADTTMFTVDGDAVTAEQFYYWLATATDSVGYYNFGSADAIDWTAEQDGQTIAQFIIADAKQMAQLYRIIETQAAKEGITLTAEEQSELKSQIAANITQMGEEEYAKQLQQMGMSDAGFRHMMEVSYLYGGVQNALFGENGKTPRSGEALAAMAEEQDLLAAKHILIKTVDDSGAALPDEEIAAAKTKAEGILAQLKAVSGDEQRGLFDQLMNENSEDGRDPTSGALYSANGYLFGAGQMVQQFEDGTRALEPGQISELVETDYGYHIILRLAPDSGDLLYTAQNTTFGEYWVSAKMKETTDGWMKAAKVEDSAEMAKVDAKSFYEQLSAYRASLQPVPSETPAPTATTTPTPTPSAGN